MGTSFDEFFEQQREQLVRLCWLSTLDTEAAVDVAQEAMARAWANWDALSGPGAAPQAWVRKVALNLARSRWRRLKRAADVARLITEQPTSSPATLSDPALLDALKKLSVRQREAVLLRYWADLPVQDCADAMGISAGSVKQHLTRAHQHLRNVMDPSSLQEMTL